MITLGANDVLKRYVYDREHTPRGRPISLNWENGLNWLKYKLKSSGVRAIFFMSIPNWTHFETELQRYCNFVDFLYQLICIFRTQTYFYGP